MLKEFKSIFPYIKKYKVNYLIGIICLLVVDGAQVLIPRFIKRTIDLVASSSFTMKQVVPIALSMLGVAAVISIGRFFWRYFIIGASRTIETEMRDKLFTHLMDMSSDFYQANKTGDLMARATNDMNSVRQSIGMALVTFIDGVYMSTMILIAMVADNPRVALYTVIPLPLVTILILFFGKLVGKQFKRVQEVYSKLSEIAQETFAGMRVVKAFVKEEHFSGRFSSTNDDYSDSTMDLVKTFGFFFPLISFLAGVSTVILLLTGGDAVVRNRMSAGDIVAMISYLEMLIWPLMGAGFTVNQIQRGAVSLKRINEVFNTKSAIIEAASPRRDVPDGDLEARGLDFAYPQAQGKALEGVSFALPKGGSLGILGRVGSGKSTLLKILPRILDPGEGMVFIGGIDIRDYALSSLRKAFGFVPQDSFLFSASVRKNILFGAPDISEARFADLARIACLERDVELFPSGWDTVVGEKGLTLSGGQKQRVAIARALALDPPILVLDDALSAVDAETEEKILRNLIAEREGKTTIFVSHRVSTLRHTDKILVLDSGRVGQYGTHEELMADEDGFYAEIAGLQALEAGVGSEASQSAGLDAEAGGR
ncbi:MAG TPA: ABC transporter ATP-binding protein [Rectinemataceae bacterium]